MLFVLFSTWNLQRLVIWNMIFYILFCIVRLSLGGLRPQTLLLPWGSPPRPPALISSNVRPYMAHTSRYDHAWSICVHIWTICDHIYLILVDASTSIFFGIEWSRIYVCYCRASGSNSHDMVKGQNSEFLLVSLDGSLLLNKIWYVL